MTDRCSNCGIAGAISRCSGCNDAPSADGPNHKGPSYCGRECQAAHWTHHKPECRIHRKSKRERTIIRAGNLLGRLFFVWREACYDRPLVKVELREDSVWVHEDYVYFRKPFPNGRLCPLKQDLFEDERTRRAVLANMGCDSSLAFFGGVVCTFIGGLVDAVHEVETVVKNIVRPTVLVDSVKGRVDTEGTHFVLKVLFEKMGLWAMDITGAQYGWDGVVMPWAKYVDERCREINGVEDFGTRRSYFGSIADDSSPARPDYKDMAVWTKRMGDRFDQIVENALEERNTGAEAFLAATDANWVKMEEAFLGSVKKEMEQVAIREDYYWQEDARVARGMPDISNAMDWMDEDRGQRVGSGDTTHSTRSMDTA